MPDETPTPIPPDAPPAPEQAPEPEPPREPPAEPAKDAAAEQPLDALRPEAVPTREKELFERLLRLQADFDNFRRRAREESAQATARGKTEFARAILPLLDNLERALKHAEDKGLELLARQLQEILIGQGLAVLDPTGEAFDAKLHEAIASEAREGVPPGTVLATVERGYALDGKIVRPARVIVAS